jgi:hypothetical protein
MTERITRSSVTFLHNFVMRDMDGVQPPGTYLIETVEDPLETLSFLAYRRVATTITLPAIGVVSRRRQVVSIDPDELQAALARDTSATTAGDESRCAREKRFHMQRKDRSPDDQKGSPRSSGMRPGTMGERGK